MTEKEKEETVECFRLTREVQLRCLREQLGNDGSAAGNPGSIDIDHSSHFTYAPIVTANRNASQTMLPETATVMQANPSLSSSGVSVQYSLLQANQWRASSSVPSPFQHGRTNSQFSPTATHQETPYAFNSSDYGTHHQAPSQSYYDPTSALQPTT